MGRKRIKEMGRKAENAIPTLRTDQFHLAFVMVVAAARAMAPAARLVKNSQFTT
jgi:hypothetical protein